MDDKQNQSSGKTYLPYLLVGVVLVLIALGGIAYWTGQAQEDQTQGESQDQVIFPPAKIDKPAPEITLESLEGGQVSLKDFRGKVVLVNNWATWCPPCKAEMPELNTYYHEHKDQGFEVVAIEAGDPKQDVKAFVDNEGIDFHVWLDPQTSALKRFGNASLPNSYVIGRDGRLRLTWTGAINLATLEKHVTPLLEGGS